MAIAIVLADGSSPVALSTRQVLQDWAAAGLLRRFLWINKGAVAASGPLEGLLIDGERSERVDIANWLSFHVEEAHQARMYALQLPDSAEHIPVSLAEQAIFRAQLQGGRHELLNLLAPGLPYGQPPVSEPWHGRPNLLIQPVDSIEPAASGHQQLQSGENTFAAQVASALASLAGLWQGMDGPAVTAIEDSLAAADAHVTVFRCFVGMIDGSSTLAGLRDSLHTDGRLPAPYAGAGRLIQLDRTRAAAETRRVAEQLSQPHLELRFTPPEGFRPPPKVKTSLRRVLADFMGFLMASIRRIPEQWYRRTVEGLANRITHAFYGDNSAYQVILRPVGVERTDLVDNLMAGVAEVGRELGDPPLPNTTRIWHSVNEAVTGLIDGSDMPEGVSPPFEGGERAVITDPALIAPAPDAAGVKVGYGVIVGAGEIRISANDPLSALLTSELLLEEQARTGPNPVNGATLATSAEAIDRFLDQQHSLLWHFQFLLAQQVQAARLALRNAANGDKQATGDLVARVAAAQRRALRFVHGMLLALLIAVAVVVTLILTPVLTLVIGLAVLFVVIVGWFFGAVWGFFNRQRLLYQLLHEANIEPLRREWAEKSRRHLHAELSRLTSLYRQSRLWTAVYTKSVPSGAGGEEHSSGPTSGIGMLSGQLPLHMRIGKAEFDPRSQAQLSRELARALFGVGWFATRLQRRFELALAVEDADPDLVQRLWNDQGINSDNPLRKLDQHLDDAEVRAAARDELTVSIVNWARQRQSGPDGAEWLSEQLMPSVALVAGRLPNGWTGSSSSDFVLRMLDGRAGHASLTADGFTAEGITRNAPALIRTAIASYAAGRGDGYLRLLTRSDPAAIGLDQLAVRIDFTRPLARNDLVFTCSPPQPKPEPKGPNVDDQGTPWIPPTG